MATFVKFRFFGIISSCSVHLHSIPNVYIVWELWGFWWFSMPLSCPFTLWDGMSFAVQLHPWLKWNCYGYSWNSLTFFKFLISVLNLKWDCFRIVTGVIIALCWEGYGVKRDFTPINFMIVKAFALLHSYRTTMDTSMVQKRIEFLFCS